MYNSFVHALIHVVKVIQEEFDATFHTFTRHGSFMAQQETNNDKLLVSVRMKLSTSYIGQPNQKIKSC